MAVSRLICYFVLSCWACCAQAQTLISGVINDYQSIIEVIPPAAIRLTDVSAYSANDRVMLWQAKGATITTTNTSAFGSITDTALAGRYELNTVCSIAGDTLQLQYDLTNSYDVNAVLQAIRVPVYDNAEVVGTVTATPWDGQTGGVIALEVTGTLTLGANIDAQGSGFRGGAYTAHSTGCNWWEGYADYYYPTGNGNGLSKGEGIAAYLAGQEWGRGPQANGGGGGNNHNSGGAGGAHIGAGGQGGENQEPGTFHCDGYHPGIGGRSLGTNPQRLFMGGGGGAGHANNNDPGSISSGGAGGGLIYLQAGTLSGNGYTLTAAGAEGGYASNDGAGGGGAGGTIVLDVAHFSGALTLNVMGGNGGDADNDGANRCYGPGGGGGGGAIYSTGALTGVSLLTNGGVAGQTINTIASCSGALGAANGGSGGVTTGATIQQATSWASSCAFLLPLESVTTSWEWTADGWALSWQSAREVYTSWQVYGLSWQKERLASLRQSEQTYTIRDRSIRYVQLRGVRRDGSIDKTHWMPLHWPEIPCEVFPNPIQEGQTLLGDITDVTLRNAHGRMLYQWKKLPQSWPPLSAGIYFIEGISAEGPCRTPLVQP